MRRNVAGGRYLVGAGRVGAEHATAVPHQFLRGQPAHALNEAALDLADVDGRVDAAARVMQDVHLQHTALAGERVDHHFGAGSAIGEIVERAPGQCGLVVVDLGRAVKPVAPELDAVGVSGLHHVAEGARGAGRDHLATKEADRAGATAVEAADNGGQVVAHVAGRELGGTAVQVGAGRSRSGRGVGHLAGVAGGGEHPLKRHAQLIGHDLGDLGVQPLAHLGAAMVDLHAAVGIDMDQRSGLVEQGGGEADAELHRRDRDAALQHRAG